jgi:hypothetical protein
MKKMPINTNSVIIGKKIANIKPGDFAHEQTGIRG